MNIGPIHPSTHGVFRMRVTFDGETIIDAEPIIGYLHRGSEKLAEERTYTQIVTLTDRMDYTASMTNNQAYILSVEKLAGIKPAERGVWLRMIAAELQRIAAHSVAIGFLINDLGACRYFVIDFLTQFLTQNLQILRYRIRASNSQLYFPDDSSLANLF